MLNIVILSFLNHIVYFHLISRGFMSKKIKKLFKSRPILAPKVSSNPRLSSWKNAEYAALVHSSNVKLSKLFTKQLYHFFGSFENTGQLISLLRLSIQHLHFDKNVHASSKNFCYYTGRSRGFNRQLLISRHVIRKFARFGMLPGLIKENAN